MKAVDLLVKECKGIVICLNYQIIAQKFVVFLFLGYSMY